MFISRILPITLAVMLTHTALQAETTETQRISQLDGVVERSNTGLDVALSGNLLAVGEPGNAAGRVHIYSLGDDAAWTPLSDPVLPPWEDQGLDNLGHSLDMDGNRLIAGIYGAGLGFTGKAVIWSVDSASEAITLEAVLEAPAEDQFIFAFYGFSAAISGDIAVVGSRNAGAPGGSAYVYERNPDDGTWQLQQKLFASDAEGGEFFGHAVAISGDRIIVGAPNDVISGAENAGAVYLFHRDTGTWTQMAKLTAADPISDFKLGWTVDIDGDLAIAGALNAGSGGQAFFYHWNGSAWTEETTADGFTVTPDADNGYWVGHLSASLSGQTAVVGGNGIDGKGAFRFFSRETGQWEETETINAAFGMPGDGLGFSLSLSGDWIASGAPFADDGANDGGAVYLFKKAPAAKPLDLADALDTTGMIWRTSSNGGWSPQSETTHDGFDAAQSGEIGDLSESFLETTVRGPGHLSFWWKVSSESEFDFLRFQIAGVDQTDAISGEVDWRKESISIPVGRHVLRWIYAKDNFVNDGLDRGWVDEVVFTPTNDVTVANQPENQIVASGADAIFSISATTISPPLSYQWRFNGTNIEGATGESLKISGVTIDDAGAYTVSLTDTVGTSISAIAYLGLTDAPPPVASTLAAENVRRDQVRLVGTVNPNGNITTAYFEYGLTEKYGNTTPASELGSAPSPVKLIDDVGSLSSGVTYHFRLVAHGNGRIVVGEDRTFTTPAAIHINCGSGVSVVDAIGRVWESDSQFLTSADHASSTTPEPIDVALLTDLNVPQTVVQSERFNFGDLNYGIPLANGSYTVVLYFAETFPWGVSEALGGMGNSGEARIFDIHVEGVTVPGYNPADAAVLPAEDGNGEVFKATELVFRNADVADGILNIDLIDLGPDNPPENPMIKGMSIFAQPQDGPVFPHRIVTTNQSGSALQITVDPGLNGSALQAGVTTFKLQETFDFKTWSDTEASVRQEGGMLIFDVPTGHPHRFFRAVGLH